MKMGLKLPKFDKPRIKKIYGFGIDEFLDELLNIDPVKRPSCRQALIKI